MEKSKYGWFWECPNGDKCIYRHALPPGYVLKKDKKKEEKPSELSLVELIEKERAALGDNTTRVTLETFLAWKKRKLQEKRDKLAADEERKKSDFSKGRQFGISGREIFSFNPSLVDDGPMEDGDAAFENYKYENDDDEVEFKELDLASLSLAAMEADGTGTIASDTRLRQMKASSSTNETSSKAGSSSDANEISTTAINKDLFLNMIEELDDLNIDEDEDSDDDDDQDDDNAGSNFSSNGDKKL